MIVFIHHSRKPKSDEADPGSAETFTNHREYRRDPAMPTSLGGHRWDGFGAYVATEMRAGRTLVVDEVRVHPGHSADDLAAYEAVGIRAYVAVPLVREGRILAYLAVNHTTPRAWTAEEIALTEETAERTWATIQRARAEAALRASEVVSGLYQAGLGRLAALGIERPFEIRLPRISAPSRLEEAVVTPDAPRRILIVDDNQDAADMLALLLTSEGHSVDVVYRSTDALERVAQQHPDVVLLDLGMPHMDGYAVVRALRAHHGNALRVIALTGYGRPEDRERTRAAGFDAHVVKPVDMQALRCSLAG